jgi:hypothetical protein
MIFYEHRQKGGRWFYLNAFITLLCVAVFVYILVTKKIPDIWVALLLFVFVTATLIWATLSFYSLTVSIDNEFVRIVFGPYALFKKFALKDITACKPVKNSVWDSWGIHMCGSGYLYNIAGYDAVEITMKSGKQNRIGTDEPKQLAETIQNIISKISAGGK